MRVVKQGDEERIDCIWSDWGIFKKYWDKDEGGFY